MSPFNHIAELIRALGSVASSSIVLLGAAGALIKPFRKLIKRWIRRTAGTEDNRRISQQIVGVQDELKTVLDGFTSLQEAQLCILRNDITHYYFSHLTDQNLTSHERENILRMSEVYKTLGGNSYIDLITQEMLGWDVDG